MLERLRATEVHPRCFVLTDYDVFGMCVEYTRDNQGDRTMIEQLLNRKVVLDALEEIKAYLDPSRDTGRRAGETLPAEADDLADGDYSNAFQEVQTALQSERRESSGQIGFDSDEARRGDQALIDDVSFFSRDPIISIVQSALEQYYQERAPDELEDTDTDDGRRGGAVPPVLTGKRIKGVDDEMGPDGRRLLKPFEITDPGWVSCLVAMGIRKLKDRYPFNPSCATTVEIPDRNRMLFFGDWASGIPRARLVSEQMRKYIDDDETAVQHVVHLGDTYYSGWPNEFEERFLDCWPIASNEADRIGSWSVNGNHDMYSGGEGFFKTLLSDPRFAGHENSSLFKMENKHWRILGIDTAYKDHDLESPQDEWITEEAHKAKEKGQKLMLLSHHQLFSSYESDGEALKTKLGPLLEQGLIDTWFWGHEHRCVVYKPHQGVRYARCIGHAGVPVYVTTKDPTGGQAPYVYHYTEDKIVHGLEKYAVFGFCVVDFDGPKISVRYINEYGDEHYRETLA